MNLQQMLISMGLSWTTLIEFIIYLLFCFIFRFWFNFLLLLCFLGFIAFKIWTLIKYQKLSARTTPFNENIPKLMKAAYYSSSWKKIIDFSEYLVPSIKKNSDQLLIKVHSASLNPVDYKLICTRIPFYRWVLFPNYGIGKDFSGEIVDMGSMVTNFRKGDNVYGFALIGTFQEYTITKERWIHLIPDRVQFDQAASLPLAGCTSYQALTYFYRNNNNNDNIYNEYGFEPDLSGKNVLVIGASGGCGHLGIQIAKFLNANQVYGVCSSDNVDIIRNIGVCEDVFAYNSPDFEQDLDNVLITEDGSPKIDLILDTVSSREDGDVGSRFMKYLKPDGNYVALNSSSIFKFCAGLFKSCIPKMNLEKKGTHVHILNRSDPKGLEVLSNMAAQGKLNFFINNVFFDYQAIENAIKMLKSRRTKGKLVCNIIDENIII